EENKLLKNWQLENPKEFNAIQLTMATKHARSYNKFDSRKGWDKMSQRIEKEVDTKEFSLKPFLRYAIAASVALAIGVFGFQLFTTESIEMLTFKNSTPNSKNYTLPDGSTILLAQNSAVEYAKNFTDNRSLKLTGAAFFDVKKNKDKPFSISTNQGLVKVLGTSFNVNSRNGKTQVDVKSGKVSLSNNNQEVKLSKNESAWSNGKSISQKYAVKINDFAWVTGEFQFDNTPFEEVIKFLELHYGDVIDVKTIINCSFTGTFANENIDGIIEAIVLSCNLEFSKENNRIILE
ncbi:MAG: FecR family protein, partial [Crocinitomicaceae bacterium]